MDRQIIISHAITANRWSVMFLDSPKTLHVREYIDLEAAQLDAKYWLTHGHMPLSQEEIEELTY